MKNGIVAASVAGTLIAVQCLAAGFTVPSAADIAKAAEKPASIAGLVKGASPEQAAEVVKAAVAAVLGLNLDAKEQGKRIAELVRIALKAISPGRQAAFAEALGKAIGGNALLRGNAAAVSAVQGAIASASGELAGVFGVAYGAAAGTGVLGTGQPDSTPSRTAPPVAKPYPNQ